MHVGNMQVSNKIMHVGSCKVIHIYILYCMHVSKVIINTYIMHVSNYTQVIHMY